MGTAIQAIYRDLEYAKTLAKQRSIASSTPFSSNPADEGADHGDDWGDIEDWTFIGDDSDDASKRMRDRAVSGTHLDEPGDADAGEPVSGN